MKKSNIGSDSSFRDAFIEGAARCFFVLAYVEFAERYDEEHDPESADYDPPASASMSADWYDMAPATLPPNAYALAGEMIAHIETANGCSIYTLAARAKEAEIARGKMVDNDEIDAEDFGRDLAMQYAGTGCSWFDDHASFALEIPQVEISAYTFDESSYRA